jgi:hypothetical protein
MIMLQHQRAVIFTLILVAHHAWALATFGDRHRYADATNGESGHSNARTLQI